AKLIPPGFPRERPRGGAALLWAGAGLPGRPQHRHLDRLRFLRPPDLAAPGAAVRHDAHRPGGRPAGADATFRPGAGAGRMAGDGRAPAGRKHRVHRAAAPPLSRRSGRAMDHVLLRSLRQSDRGQGLPVAGGPVRAL
ncbi:MAG: Putative ring-cleaving dioxygenase, partial [uncultured Ramlibacter sp.]